MLSPRAECERCRRKGRRAARFDRRDKRRPARAGLRAQRQLATALFLALSLERPLFLEGEPGTGKTELAKTVAHMLGRPLLRLQCYEGLDINAAAYEWNYALQMMEIRLSERADQAAVTAGDLFGERF